MSEQKKMTFAQKAILNRIAQKEAMNQKQSGFQDYKEYYTDYHDSYSVYGDSNAAWLDGTPVVDTEDYGDSHSGWLPGGCKVCDDVCVEPTVPADHKSIDLLKPTFFQRLFGKYR